MLINDIYKWARIQPRKSAFVYNDVVLDYGTFARAIEITRRFLEQQHLPRGKVAVIITSSVLDNWIIDIAFRPLGLQTVSVLSIELAEKLQLRNVACVVTTETEPRRYACEWSALARNGSIVIPRSIYTRIDQSDLPSPLARGAAGGGQIFCTSGTTGSHKKILFESKTEAARNAARAVAHNFSNDTVHHLVLGHWISPPQKRAPAVWHVGGTIIVDQRAEGRNRVFEHAPNRCFLGALLPRGLMNYEVKDELQIPCKIEFGAALPSIEATRRALQISGDASIEYGASELGLEPLYCDIDNQQDVFWFRAANGRTVQIVDDEMVECAPGRQGTLRIKCHELDCSSYLHDPALTSKIFRDGYFYPGDMAVKRADGCIRILGRVADVINMQGNKVAVGPIEQDLQRYLKVEDVALFSHLNDEGIDELVVALQSSSMPPEAKLDNVRREFPLFERVSFRLFSAFPRTETGKVRRIELKNLAAGKSATNA